MNSLVSLLAQWFDDAAAARIRPVGASGGFSGSQVWIVEFAGRAYALKRWPASMASRARLEAIHAFQIRLARSAPPIVPAPVATRRRATVVEAQGRLWELAPWMPGVADYWRNPRPEKLDAALAALARIHLTAADHPRGRSPAHGVSPALVDRHDRLERLLRDGLAPLREAVGRAAAGDERRLAVDACEHIAKLAPSLAARVAPWRSIEAPLQWRLGDVWHDHVLFTGDRVTGLIDFGAATVDAPAGDVARLTGSLVGDDHDAWRRAMTAYQRVRPLSAVERSAISIFDATGTVLAAANWIEWLWGESENRLSMSTNAAALERLARLAARLRAHVCHSP